jgi:hypothetical protein
MIVARFFCWAICPLAFYPSSQTHKILKLEVIPRSLAFLNT